MKKRTRELVSYLLERAKTKSDINEHLLFLYKLVLKTNAQKIVELGTRDGNSTCAFVIGAAQTGGHVVSVDYGKGAEYAGEPPTWDALAQTSALITSKLGLGDFWTLVVKDDLDFAREYHDEVDLLFIDTNHSYEQTKRELEAWGTRVVNRGMILIHDTVSFPEQNKAIWEFLDRYPLSEYVEHKNCNGLGIITKNTTGLTKTKIPRSKQELTPGLWRDRVDRMQEALTDMRHLLREKDNDLVARLKQERANVELDLLQRLRDPLGKLLTIYAARPDLQSSFPEVDKGDYSRLLDWAREQAVSGEERAHQLLASDAPWYEANPWHRLSELSEELNRTKTELAQRESMIKKLKSDPLSMLLYLYASRADLQQAFPEVREGDYARLLDWAKEQAVSGEDGAYQLLASHASWYEANPWHRLSELSEELNRTKSEFDSIRHSFGYKLMKFYARIIDALLPEGTTRGELKKTTVASLHVLTEQGVASLSRQIFVKIKRREFTIIDPATKRPTKTAQSLSIPSTGEFNDDTLQRELQLFLSKDDFLQVPSDKSPRLSIVIVTYNKAHYAYRCLRCLLDDDLPPFELIVVDNASSDQTVGLLEKVRNARVMMNSSNQYFARANNQAASAAKGEYLLFLNQDAFIHKGCVSSLMRTLDSSRDIGAVGAKLVARDGRLLEAGSIVWRDGSCLGYGRGDDPGKPEYCYVRDVDYSSAACLMVRREAFHDVGGFDENFIPAYYEDTDLCMRLWERGLRVVYQPLAVATHLEFSASSLESATKLMARQQHAFVHKHESALLRKSVPAPANVLKARDRSDRSRIVVVDDRVPKPIEGSGFPRMFSMLKAMASLGYRVTLLPSADGTPKQPETEILTQMGIEVLWGTAGIEILNSRPNYYDVALISRPHNALFGIDLVRATNPNARIIYDAEALWYRRENLKRRLGFPSVDARFESEDFEISLIQKADYVIAVSNLEKSILQDRLQDKQRVLLIGHTHTNSPTLTSFEDRRDLLFLGGFMSAQGECGPNDDAAVYFAKTIFPHIKKKIPEIHFIIAGSDAPKSVWQLASESVSVLGYVQDLRELYAKARVFVVPIRFGAGAMWKVTEAMSLGLPCMLSAVAAEGLEIKDREEALIACDEGEFIEKTIQLYNDKALWADMRKRALDYVAKNCDPTGMEEKLDHLLRQASRAVKR